MLQCDVASTSCFHSQKIKHNNYKPEINWKKKKTIDLSKSQHKLFFEN